MRMLMRVKLPHDKFNAAVKDGTAGERTKRSDQTLPEIHDGQRRTSD